MSNLNFYDEKVLLIDTVHAAGGTPFIYGPPGEGKTSIVSRLAERDTVTYNGVEQPVAGFISIGLPAMEPGDLQGMPYIDPKSAKITAYDKAGRPVIDPTTGEPHTEEVTFNATNFTIPTWAVQATMAEGVFYVIVDEATRTPDNSMPDTLLEIINNNLLPNGHKLPPTVKFILMGNTADDDPTVNRFVPAMTSRLLHTQFVAPFGDWSENMPTNWGRPETLSERQMELRTLVVTYLRDHTAHFRSLAEDDKERGWANPRTWTRLADTLASLPQEFRGDDRIVQNICNGIVGNNVGGEFALWLKNIKVPSAEEVIANPRVLDNVTPDVAWAALSYVKNHLMFRETEEVAQFVERAGAKSESEVKPDLQARTEGPLLTFVDTINEVDGRHSDISIAVLNDVVSKIVTNYGVDIITSAKRGSNPKNRSFIKSQAILDGIAQSTRAQHAM